MSVIKKPKKTKVVVEEQPKIRKIIEGSEHIRGRVWLGPNYNKLEDGRLPNIMVVGAYPPAEDVKNYSLYSASESGEELLMALEKAGIPFDTVWLTTMVKFGIGTKTKPTREDIAECWECLEAEIEHVQPKLIIPLGAEAFKRVMKSQMGVSDYIGEVIDCPYGCKLLANHSPGTILNQDPTKRGEFIEIFEMAYRMFSGTLVYDPFKYVVVDKVKDSQDIINNYIDKGMLSVGYDLEWLGKKFTDDEVVFTAQYSCEKDLGIVLNISDDGIHENRELLNTLKPLLEHSKADRLGWNIRADDERLTIRGFNLADETLGFDGMKAVSFINSSWGKGLETGIKRFTKYEPYYVWLNQALRKHKLDKTEMSKLKFIDPLTFYYYCAGDAVSHREACLNMRAQFPAETWPFYRDVYLPLSNYILDMEITGMPIDVELMQKITDMYVKKYEELLPPLHEKLAAYNVTDFNPKSAPQKKKLLFETLKLTPAYWTKAGKSPKPHSWYVQQNPRKQALFSPSTNAKSLSTMAFHLETDIKAGKPEAQQKYEIIKNLLDLGRVNVFANQFFSKRGVDDPDAIADIESEVESEDEGEPLKQSYWAALCKDNRIHASFFECLKNYRSSSTPQVQNPASKVLAHIPNIFVPGYTAMSKDEQKKVSHLVPPNIRNIFYSGNPDYYFAEVDVAGADLGIMAFLSGDEKFIYDIRKGSFHVSRMRDYFQDPALTKNDVSKYVISKSISFRISYTSGLTSAALPIQADVYSENGLYVELDFINFALDTWKKYDKYLAYRDLCTAQSELGYITHPRGMKLLFGETENQALKAGYANQALAYPVAGELATFVYDVSVNVRKKLKADNVWMKQIYPIDMVHDACYWLVHKDLMKDNYFPDIVKHYFTKEVKLASGDNLGIEMVVGDRWKGKEKVFSKETVWDFDEKCWKWEK